VPHVRSSHSAVCRPQRPGSDPDSTPCSKSTVDDGYCRASVNYGMFDLVGEALGSTRGKAGMERQNDAALPLLWRATPNYGGKAMPALSQGLALLGKSSQDDPDLKADCYTSNNR